MKTNLEKLYHISFRSDLPSVMKPRQPDGSDEGNKNTITSEDLPPRVSFSPTIQQCFSAIYANVSQFFEQKHFPYMVFYVYSPIKGMGETLDSKLVYDNVWDSHYTEEVCYSTPIRVIRVAKIKILNPGENAEEIFVHPYDDKKIEKRFLSPVIKYEIIEKYENNLKII